MRLVISETRKVTIYFFLDIFFEKRQIPEEKRLSLRTDMLSVSIFYTLTRAVTSENNQLLI